MWKFAVPGVLLTLAGIVWTLQGLVGKTSSGGMNGHPVWAAIGIPVAVIGIGLVVAGRRVQQRTRT